MTDILGEDMDTWIVARKPIAFLNQTRKLPVEGTKQDKV